MDHRKNHPHCRVVVLIGGNGSNLQALIDNQAKFSAYSVVGVISHKPDAYGLIRAQNALIPTTIVDHTRYSDRQAFEQNLILAIESYEPDLIVLAGFMRLLSSEFVERYPEKILNIHPALLPKYKGLNTHQRVLDNKDKEHGATVHFVTKELDDGPIIAQVKVPVLPSDSVESLRARVLSAEHKLYPQVISWIAQKRLKCDENIVTLDGNPLEKTLMQGIVS